MSDTAGAPFTHEQCQFCGRTLRYEGWLDAWVHADTGLIDSGTPWGLHGDHHALLALDPKGEGGAKTERKQEDE